MIQNWAEIQTRYAAIKDHKPRATKKLKELGEILASAFLLNPQQADEMWQYIIELNTSDDITFSKFYIAQVFKKLTEILPPQDAVVFVSMRPERLRLMLIYGYDGDTLKYVTYILLGGQILNDRLDDTIETISYLEEKFSIQEGLNGTYLFDVMNATFKWLEEKPGLYVDGFRYDIPIRNLLTFYDHCDQSVEDTILRSIVLARMSMLMDAPIQDQESVQQILYDLLRVTTHDYFELHDLFTDFLYFERNIVGNQAENYLYEYITSASALCLPLTPNIPAEISDWYIKTLYRSQKNLRVMVSYQCCNTMKRILHQYMYEEDWKSFLNLLIMGLNQETNSISTSYLLFLQAEMQDYLAIKDRKVEHHHNEWYVLGETRLISPNMSASYASWSSPYKPRINSENIQSFIQVLAQACILTSSSDVNVQLMEAVQSFITKVNGNLDALKAVGIETKENCKTELQRFCEYAERESTRRPDFDNSYHSPQIEDSFIKSIQSETGTHGVETGKHLSKQPQILSFLFLHDAHSFQTKVNIIIGALLDDDYSAAMKCVEYMIETADYPNFSDLNSWSMEMKNTVKFLLLDINMYKQSYSESIISAVIQIAKMCLPYLNADEAKAVKTELYKVSPAKDDIDSYIEQLMQDVDDYTAKKKPGGYSKRINDITSRIIDSFELLSKVNRIDVIAQILRKITDGRQYIAGPSYEAWMTGFLRVTNEQLQELYLLIPDVYAKYIEISDPKMAQRLLAVFRRMSDKLIYQSIKDQVLQKHGFINGMDV